MKKKNKIWFLLLLGLFLTGCQKSNAIRTDNTRQSDGERYMGQYQFYVNSVESAKDARGKLENISVDVNAN